LHNPPAIWKQGPIPEEIYQTKKKILADKSVFLLKEFHAFSKCSGSRSESGMFFPDPDFYPFRISDSKTASKERGENKLVVIPFFVATNFT
jgi:hypothetical protein